MHIQHRPKALEWPEAVRYYDYRGGNRPSRHAKHDFFPNAQVNVLVVDELHASSINVPNAGQGNGS